MDRDAMHTPEETPVWDFSDVKHQSTCLIVDLLINLSIIVCNLRSFVLLLSCCELWPQFALTGCELCWRLVCFAQQMCNSAGGTCSLPHLLFCQSEQFNLGVTCSDGANGAEPQSEEAVEEFLPPVVDTTLIPGCQLIGSGFVLRM